MMRFCAAGSRSDRQCAAANLVVLNVPLMCTRITSSHSCSDMLNTIRSRRIPATLTSTSSRPNCSMADETIACAAEWSETSAPLAAALPPASVISATTWSAGPTSLPEPSTAEPRSLTSTAAPSAASRVATDLPIPRPAPVTIATRPSSSPISPPTRPGSITRIIFWNYLLAANLAQRAWGRQGRHRVTADAASGKQAAGAWQWGRTKQTQRALLDAARDVFTEQGFSNASIADVVERAGSSVGSLYHHFGGKSELFLALWQDHQVAHEKAASQSVAAARKSGEADPTALFCVGARAFLEGSWHRRDLEMLFVSGDGPPGFELIRRRRLHEWISQNDALLRLADTSLDRLYAAILTSLIGVGAREVAAARTRRQASEIIDAVIEYATRIMAGGPANP